MVFSAEGIVFKEKVLDVQEQGREERQRHHGADKGGYGPAEIRCSMDKSKKPVTGKPPGKGEQGKQIACKRLLSVFEQQHHTGNRLRGPKEHEDREK